MENEEKRARSLTISSGLAESILTAAIVAVRAFQPNAVPMEDWSFVSWILMTLPVTWPTWFFVLWWTAAFLVETASAIFRKRR
jgi:hypothetical protein